MRDRQPGTAAMLSAQRQLLGGETVGRPVICKYPCTVRMKANTATNTTTMQTPTLARSAHQSPPPRIVGHRIERVSDWCGTAARLYTILTRNPAKQEREEKPTTANATPQDYGGKERRSARAYSCPNPIVSSTAIVIFCCSISSDLYGGRSRRLKLDTQALADASPTRGLPPSGTP